MKRILIVDDDPGIVSSLVMLLEEKYEVTAVSDGFAAMKRLKAAEYDLILLDLLLPGLDGVGFVHALEESGSKTPILLMSASTNVARHAQGLHVADYVGKPFHIDELEAKIDRVIGTGNAAGAEQTASRNEGGLTEPVDLAEKPLVLFVDDQPELLASVKSLLAEEPYEVLTTERPEQALKWVQEKVVSLVICDQVLPGQLGTDILDEICVRSPATLVAILTAYPEGEKLLRKLTRGNFLMIPKPFDSEALKRTIRKLLYDWENRKAANWSG